MWLFAKFDFCFAIVAFAVSSAKEKKKQKQQKKIKSVCLAIELKCIYSEVKWKYL